MDDVGAKQRARESADTLRFWPQPMRTARIPHRRATRQPPIIVWQALSGPPAMGSVVHKFVS
jgi:hypothetical protein